MNQYKFAINTGEERESRDQRVEVRAENIVDALRKMEALVLQKEKGFILSLAIGGRIVECEKIEEEAE